MTALSLRSGLPFPVACPVTGAASRAESSSIRAEEEDAWLEAARGGDPDSYGRLVARHADRVYETVLRILRSPEAAEEVAQDAFVRAWQGLGSFRGDSRFSTWLYTIATRRALDVARAEKRRREREGPVDAAVLEAAPDPAASREPAERRWLERVLGELDPVRRAAVTLHYLRDCPVAEVATILGMPEGTVKTHLHRARASMRAAWEQEGGRELR
jgi:RNA polymerase sigma-70 factor (ECF subfamily)